MEHGLLRAVAQLYFGEQSERSIRLARGWLRRRLHFSTGVMLEILAQRVYPKAVVEKSPSVVYKLEYLERIRDMFPDARFIHLVRHPIGHGESVMKSITEAGRVGRVPDWVLHLAGCPDLSGHDWPVPENAFNLDPQYGWYALHMKIHEFLGSVSAHQKIQIRGEDLINNPTAGLEEVARRLGVRTDANAVELMMHPERSQYACYGPLGARLGNDAYFLQSPALRPDRAKVRSLEEPLSWLDYRFGLLPEVKELAVQFGYT